MLKSWAKTANATSLDFHPLSCHNLDVAASACVLLNTVFSELGGELEGERGQPIRSWLVFLMALHDIGKVWDGFQGQRQDLVSILNPSRLGKGKVYDAKNRHDTAGLTMWWGFIASQVGCPTKKPKFAFGKTPIPMRQWTTATFWHHGAPASAKDPREVDVIPNPFRRDSLAVQEYKHVEPEVRWYVDSLLRILNVEVVSEDLSKKLTWMVAGLAVLADWIGSNSKWFPFHEVPKTNAELAEYWGLAVARATRAMKESKLTQRGFLPFPGFSGLYPGFTPRPLQKVVEEIPLSGKPSLYILEAPTGEGKTEAALTLAHRMVGIGQTSGIFFALPTMATSNAMYQRLCDVAPRILEDPDIIPTLAHSGTRLREPLQGILDGEVYDPGMGNSWMGSRNKTALLAPLAVGTIDQALLGILPTRHQAMRLLGLHRKVLILDEIHACDPYQKSLALKLVQIQRDLGGSVICMSATIPQAFSRELHRVFDGAPPAEGARAFPCISGRDFSMPITASKEKDVRVHIATTEAEVESAIASRLAKGECVLWVRNTVGDAQEIYEVWSALWENTRVFHSRFSKGDRALKERDLLADFGPSSSGEQRKGQLVIATQIVEQSLDIDFDYLIVDLCPMDSFLQRVGREHRHSRDARGNRAKVEGRGIAEVLVYGPEYVEEPQGDWYRQQLPRAAYVYQDVGRLWLTLQWLREHAEFSSPKDNRKMVEYVFGHGVEERVPEALRDKLTPLWLDQYEGTLIKDLTLDLEKGYEKGYNDAKGSWGTHHPKTRDGEYTVTVRLLRKVGSSRVQPWFDADLPGEHEQYRWELSDIPGVPHYKISKSPHDDLRRIKNVLDDMPGKRRVRLEDDNPKGDIICVCLDGLGSGSAWNKSSGEEVLADVLYSSGMGLQIVPIKK